MKVVINQFGVPYYDSTLGRYKMIDSDDSIFWLDDQVYAETVDYMTKEYIKEGKSEEEAHQLAEAQAFEGWGADMHGIEAD